jgi:hypothetical protein
MHWRHIPSRKGSSTQFQPTRAAESCGVASLLAQAGVPRIAQTYEHCTIPNGNGTCSTRPYIGTTAEVLEYDTSTNAARVRTYVHVYVDIFLRTFRNKHTGAQECTGALVYTTAEEDTRVPE